MKIQIESLIKDINELKFEKNKLIKILKKNNNEYDLLKANIDEYLNKINSLNLENENLLKLIDAKDNEYAVTFS